MKGKITKACAPLETRPEETQAVLANSISPSTRDRGAKKEKVIFSARIPATLRQRMRLTAVSSERTLEDCVAEALEQWLKRQTK